MSSFRFRCFGHTFADIIIEFLLYPPPETTDATDAFHAFVSVYYMVYMHNGCMLLPKIRYAIVCLYFLCVFACTHVRCVWFSVILYVIKFCARWTPSGIMHMYIYFYCLVCECVFASNIKKTNAGLHNRYGYMRNSRCKTRVCG